MEPMMASQSMAPASFFYYSPDPNPENRHHGHFIPQPQPHPQQMAPHMLHQHQHQHQHQHHQHQHQHQQQHGHLQQPMQMFPMVPTVPSTPAYSRPTSSCSQPAAQPPRTFACVPSQMTPMASPQPVMAHKPTIVLDMDKYNLHHKDGIYYPSTPPLSTSGGASATSSPGSCDMLATPLNPMFSGLDGYEDTKQESDLQVEKFPVLDWSNCASPPLTPVYLQSQTQLGKVASLPLVSFNLNNQTATTQQTTATPSDLLSTASCPSLSPSPAPYARSVSSSSEDLDFCDPRNLTVGASLAASGPEITSTPLPTLFEGDEDIIKGGDHSAVPSVGSNQPSTFEFAAIPHGLPAFDDLSDLESDDDFVNGLVNLNEQPVLGPISRSRASSGALSLGEDDFSDFDSSFRGLPSPPNSSCHDSDCHHDKRQKMDVAADKQPGTPQQQTSEHQQAQEASTPVASHDYDLDADPSTPVDGETPLPAPAPANRRGRKQSLTEDPTKTFVCDQCNRRFRRQEHLKRHYRSLHTADKPFECNECGKKFSRSDNLAQHARTHGSGAIPLDFPDDAAAAAAGYAHGIPMFSSGTMAPDSQYHSLGKMLFQVASEMPGSGSDLSSSDESDGQSKKKRKRAD